jgi:multidrug resistance efflux pump
MHFEKSLQSLKADLANKETTLKAIQTHYPHLSNLSEKQILSYFEVDTVDALSTHINTTKPYTKNEDHHRERNISLCSCTDAQRKAKDLYESEESAKEQISKLPKEKRLQLSVYRCPYGCGWHLTKR